MNKLSLLVISFLLLTTSISAQNSTTNYIYNSSDGEDLTVDIYSNSPLGSEIKPCVIYIFGGGFAAGSIEDPLVKRACRELADSGYIAAAIDYRLLMKGEKFSGIKGIKSMKKAIDAASEDLISATKFLIEKSNEIGIDPSKIALYGSSAGAITALQTDYNVANGYGNSSLLPRNFRYAGVISMAGAIFSTHGKPKYRKFAPAPTLLFHGMDDKLVTYKKIQFFNIGFFGTKNLIKRFIKEEYPFYAIRYRDLGHEVAEIPVSKNATEIFWFLRHMVLQKEFFQIDETIFNPAIERTKVGSYSTKELYK